jgi:hypothetical protein
MVIVRPFQIDVERVFVVVGIKAIGISIELENIKFNPCICSQSLIHDIQQLQLVCISFLGLGCLLICIEI